MSDEFNARRLMMRGDELLDAHRKMLEADPGYRMKISDPKVRVTAPKRSSTISACSAGLTQRSQP